MRDEKRDRPSGELLGELYRDTSTLLRLEIELLKTEMSQKVSRVGKNVGFLAAGGAVAYAGLLAIIAGVIGVLALVVPVWLSALIVGLVVAGAGGLLVRSGLKTLQQEQLVPQKTLQTLQEDTEWAKDQTK
ncbi:MAG: phage holin family protein [Rubrobacter sp.]|nr:phage holin family protein [Rubrobacter sp.]